jgi:hypothetical protein
VAFPHSGRIPTVSAEDAVERSKEIYGPLGGKFNEAKLRWRMPNGGRMAFAYLESVADADEYQGTGTVQRIAAAV